MNRKDRRAAARRHHQGPGTPARSIEAIAAQARVRFEQGGLPQARSLLNEVLARAPAHVDSLNLLALIEQSGGRHAAALRLLKKAVATDPCNAASHYNLGLSYQAMGAPAEAAAAFREAIALGLDGQDVSRLIMQNAVVADALARIERMAPARPTVATLFGPSGIAPVAGDVFLRCALETTRAQGTALETFLTALRFAFLQLAATGPGPQATGQDVLALCASLAQQCFINEYVFAVGGDEEDQAATLRRLLQDRIADGGEVPPFLISIVAAYSPLHTLSGADALLVRTWPPAIEGLLRQQVREPRAEAQDRAAIPSIVAVTDAVSVQVQQQYEENPYPRWTLLPRPDPAAGAARPENPGEAAWPRDILVAGCGTGQHSIMTAQAYPHARVLAVDLSRASLAYARRKTAELGVAGIEYAHGDIMGLGAIDRRFDYIESIGVLHHLADPLAGWRVLLSLLRPGGVMVVGLYSAAARRGINAARAFIKENGWQATAPDIRAARQALIRREARMLRPDLTAARDFYAMSDCRDLLFHVMEHQFTIAQIRTFLAQQGLSFLGFELDDAVLDRFQAQFPGEQALTDLDHWETFEAANPETFLRMYLFHVRKPAQAGPSP